MAYVKDPLVFETHACVEPIHVKLMDFIRYEIKPIAR